MSKKVGVIGFGKWGKALTKVLCNASNDVMIYTRQDCNDLSKIYREVKFLNDLSKLIKFSDVVVITTKASDVELLIEQLQVEKLKIKNCIISSKGFSENGLLLSEVISDIANEVSVLAGPNFAHEIIDGKLTISILGGNVDDVFSCNQFKVERCRDIIGLQVCSIMKNIYAIGCGIVSAQFDSENTKAAFITMVFNELIAAIEMFGGEKETIYNAAGIGDLILTCYSKNSRNHMFGEMFVNGNIDKTVTVEGCDSIMRIRSDIREKLPICDKIYKIIINNENPQVFINTVFNY